ncbi:response regulator (plasmid) [Methylomonas sp. 2BW1-5-20]|uniref:response regulator n=1 Tax=Methylomonas sp. 2BW1-5-20 TaxID=3376686 RepID=UPI004050E10A
MSEFAAKSRPLILIIDDILDNVEAVGEILSAEYAIQFATSGPEGLDLIKRKAPDLILLDVMMPEMDGYAVFAELSRNPENARIPVIFVTSHNDIENELKALSVGAVDFISKPIIPEIVRARVHTHLSLRQRERDVQQLNTLLESRVQERTQQVQSLNSALEERAKQAEAASKAKTLFLNAMSHELRTPMSAIIGFSHLLLQKITDPAAVNQLSSIRKAANLLSDTINEILEFTQIESGGMTKVSDDFDLADIFRHVNDSTEDQAMAKNLRYSSRIDPNIPRHLIGDPLKLEQVLRNLIANAIKFTREGSVTIEAKLVSRSEQAVDIRILVQDTGIGIEPAKLEQIFTPFEQADTGLTRQYGGVGLGLSINRKLIEMIGGTMGVASEEGKGSTFWVALTLKLGTPPVDHFLSLPAVQMLRSLMPKPRVLLVDDDSINRSIFGMYLDDAELPFDTAGDGAEAVSKAQRHPYALILMDVQMPIMNGLDATRAIRQLPEKALTPILAISANAFDEDRARCFEAGMNAFLAKPVLPDPFHAELAKWLV